MAREATERGFVIYARFKDAHGHEVRVQESSLMDPHVWVFINDDRHLPSPPHCVTPEHLHLNPEKARDLRDALSAWLDDLEGGHLTASSPAEDLTSGEDLATLPASDATE